MGDLDIEIKVAVANALAELGRAEAAASKAEKAFDGFAATFKRIAEHEKRMASETAQARGAIDNLAGSFAKLGQAMRAEQMHGVGKAFAGLTEQIKREQSALEAIHGPMKQYQQDLQTLDILLKRGEISAEQHAAALEKSRRATSEPQTVTSQAVGVAMNVAGPAALGAFAVKGITEEIDRWHDHKMATQEATNSVLKFHDTFAQASAAMGEQKQLAKDLHIEITRTTAAYSAVREASAEMYLTSKQQVDITRNLTAAIVADGGAIEDVGGIMQKFQIAMEAGGMTARELKGILVQSDDVMAMMEKSTGKTYKQLMEMAKAGKLNTEVLLQAVTGFASNDTAMKKYSERALDVHKVQDELNISLVDAVIVVGEAKDAYEASLPTMAELFMRNVNASTKLQDSIANVAKTMANTSAFAAFAAVQITMADAIARANGDLAMQKSIVESINGPTESYTQKITNLTTMLANKDIGIVDFTYQLKQANDALFSATPAMQAMTQQHAAGSAAAKKHADELAAYAASVRKANAWQWDGEAPDAISGGTKPTDPQTANVREVDVGSMKPFEYKEINTGAADSFRGIGQNFDAKQVEDWKKEVEESKKMVDEIAEHMKPLEDFFVTAATTGKLEWRSMVDSMIADLTRLAAKKLIMGIAGGAVDGVFGGGANGFDSVVPGGSGMFLPGFANGGDFTVGGSGSTDSKLAMFRVTPGESVHVRTPEQQQAASQNAGGGTKVVLEDRRDPRALMQGGADTTRMVIEAIRSNPGAVRALLGR